MRKTKGTKVAGLFQVIRTGSGCMGCMGMETPFVILGGQDRQYRWWSDYVEPYWFNRGDLVEIEAFSRHNNPERLYRVKVKAIVRAQ